MVTSCIATELLPARPAASIKKRFINVISECACESERWLFYRLPAVLVMSGLELLLLCQLGSCRMNNI